MTTPKETILVIEDEATTKALVLYKLQNSGYKVDCVSDGTEGLDYLETSTPDLIILDLMMPLMSGKEFLIIMRQNERYRNIPVIILTAKTLERDIIEGLSLGADDFIKKPFSPSELAARVRALLARRERS
jgi:DNA-binding response OmpR family regulator